MAGDIVSLPSQIEIQPENIPDQLKERPRWLLWRWENRGGKLTKPPFQLSGSKASVNDPKTWSTFNDVIKVLAESGKYHGLGFVLTEDDDLIAWDLDHCIDFKTGALAPWAEKIVETLQSYTEITPSGEGLRVFVKGDLPQNGRKKGPVECYKNLRYITVTGNLYPGFPTEIKENSLELWEEYFAGKAVQPKKQEKKKRRTDQIDFLIEGNWKEAGFPSQSEADLAFCRYLAEQLSGDTEKVDKAFRESKLFREKWDKVHHGDGKTYGQVTIELALKAWESQFRLTDVGNAKRFANLIKDEVKYCQNRWYIWDGKRIGEDRLGKIYILSQRVVNQLKEEARNSLDEEYRKALLKHAVQLESRGRLESMIALTSTHEDIAMLPEDLDKNPYLFNADNGILDSKGAIKPHAFEEFITKISPVSIVPKAKCPTWEKFLDKILPDKDVQNFLQCAVGYSMTGSIKEQVLFFCYGTGQNGKSTFFHIITKIFGDYASQLPVESLMASKSDQHPTILADLRGVRFVLASEPEDGRRFNEGLLKQITGGEKIVARRMREDFSRFDSTAKLWIMGNHKPTIRGTDYAIWRRIRLIPFTVVIPKEEQDKDLWTKLENELEGILMWCIKGLNKYLKEGLNPPKGITTATEEYRQEMDNLQDFINEECELINDEKEKHSVLYKAYVNRMNESNERLISSKAFGQKMREKGFFDHRGTGNHLYWQGIRLKNRPTQRDI